MVFSLGTLGDGDARLRKLSFLIGEVNSSDDEELRLMDWFDHSGLTLIRAVFRTGRDG